VVFGPLGLASPQNKEKPPQGAVFSLQRDSLHRPEVFTGPKTAPSGWTFAKAVNNVIRRLMQVQKLMAGLRAEMRNIHDGCRITGQKAQNRPLWHCPKRLARFQDG
jgi:hypothetical protein